MRRVIAMLCGVALLWTGCGSGGGGSAVGRRAAVQKAVAHVGFLSVSASPPFVDALRQGLADLGYTEGKNLELDIRTTTDEQEVPALAAALVAEKVDVLIAGGTVSIAAAQKATTTIPIVMTNSGDPVATGFVQSAAHPGGNITGLQQHSPTLAPKRLDLLKEAFPGAKKVGLLYNPDHPTAHASADELRAASTQLGLDAVDVQVTSPDAIGPAIDRAAADGVQALMVLRTPFTVNNAPAIIDRIAAHRLPAMYETRNYVDAGGLMLYGPSFADLYRRSAGYVDKILKGASPADIPVEQPSRFEFVINQKTAHALGLSIPESVLARADEVLG
ncbi:MAG: ABC transporter substrate-binding protein [Actinobacteria bacterium]|nr:ABC transporter substrate-binding protein [Actinomycetota bacterium]